MANGSTTDKTLTGEDAPDIVEMLLDVQNDSYCLGIMLNVKISDMKAIKSKYQDPKERLVEVIYAFLHQTETRPTWRTIVRALRTRTVNQKQLALRLEAIYCPEPPATSGLHETTDEVKSKPSSDNECDAVPSGQSQTMKQRIQDLEEQLQCRHQEISCLKSLVQELQSKCQEQDSVATAPQQLKQKVDELEKVKTQLSLKLSGAQDQLKQKEELVSRKETELARAEETIRRERQDFQETRQRVTKMLHCALQQFQNENTAPCELYGGSATTDGQFAYFISFDSPFVYRYDWNTEKWDTLPSLPHMNSGLVIIDGELCAVGGSLTNQILTLRWTKWVKEYPQMNSARSSPAVVSISDGSCVIVIGGLGANGGWTTTVELLQVTSRRWCKLTDLPRPLTRPSVTICGEILHIIGDHANGYSTSLQTLPSSHDMPQLTPPIISWTSLPPLPVKGSTAATLCGHLVIVGGRSDSQPSNSVHQPSNSIHQLVNNEWVEIAYLASCRYRCLVASPSADKIIIVGGKGEGAQEKVEKVVELAIGKMNQAHIVIHLL